MPRFDLQLLAQTKVANDIVMAGERSRLNSGSDWTNKRLEFLYELSYLRLFAAWEAMLESIFLRSLCGYASRHGQEQLVSGAYYAKISGAEAAMLAAESRGPVTKTYVLWHSPTMVVNRCRLHIRSGGGLSTPAIQEIVIASNQARLEAFAAVRHRIVHEQKDAKTKFDNATLMFAGKTYEASRPGKFLRDWDKNASPQCRWIDTAIAELAAMVVQMV